MEIAVGELSEDCPIFGEMMTVPVGLQPNEDLYNEVFGLDPELLGCKIGSVWKVSRKTKKVRQLAHYSDFPQSASRIFEGKSGHGRPDYLLIVPEEAQVWQGVSSLVKKDRLGLVRVSMAGRGWWSVVGKEDL